MRKILLKQALLKKMLQNWKRNWAQESLTQQKEHRFQRQVVVTKKELDKIENTFKSRNRTFHQNYFEIASDLLKTVQLQLKKGKEQLIEFFDGDSAVYMLTITPEKLFLQKSDKVIFSKSVDRYVKYLSDRQLMNADFNGFVKTSNELYRLIFEKQPPQPGKIIVSHDSRYFPVEALLTNSFSDKPIYLIKLHPISYSHSARFLVGQTHSAGSNSGRNFLGIAPVNFSSGLSQVPLTGSDESLKKLLTSIPGGKRRTHRKATRENFLKEFSDYTIIQLYTHATDGSGKGEPEIYFADSILYLSDLVNERKPVTRLIVLSACETGTGQWYGGEGVFSFNRGFAALGIPSSITNLWRVENKSTYRLTELFYKYLAEGADSILRCKEPSLNSLKPVLARNKCRITGRQRSWLVKRMPLSLVSRSCGIRCFGLSPLLFSRSCLLQYGQTISEPV